MRTSSPSWRTRSRSQKEVHESILTRLTRARSASCGPGPLQSHDGADVWCLASDYCRKDHKFATFDAEIRQFIELG
jgi:hypothetical protein